MNSLIVFHRPCASAVRLSIVVTALSTEQVDAISSAYLARCDDESCCHSDDVTGQHVQLDTWRYDFFISQYKRC